MLLTIAKMPLTAASPISIATEHTTNMPVIAIASVAISREFSEMQKYPFFDSPLTTIL
jgi:hypothetical protein